MNKPALYIRRVDVPVMPGDVLAGKYQVDRILGEGGMGIVVAARHLELDQTVALKFLRPEAVANPEALDRFMREARNAVRLRSEHVARIVDVGKLDSGAPYIVMEYLEGSDLADVLAQQRTLPVPVAVDFILQACDAIAEAHALGIIHRDLKPQNLFVTRRRDDTSLIKVLDFGISKSTTGDNFIATTTQTVMGSPAYMSPEQMRSSKFVDVRTDVWALGIILYQLVVGHVPWKAETFAELCLRIATDPLPPFGNAQPAGFEEVVRRCLQKTPARRFSNVHALAVALLPFAPKHAQPLVESIGRVLRGEADKRDAIPTVIGRALPGKSGERDAMSTVTIGQSTLREATGQSVKRTATGSQQRKLVGLIAVIGLLVGFAVTVVALSGHSGEPSNETTSSPLPDRMAAQPAPAPALIIPQPSPPPQVSQPEPPTTYEPPPAATPPTKIEPTYDSSIAVKPSKKGRRHPSPIATPSQPPTAELPAPTPTPPTPAPTDPTLTPDPLAYPD